ncbi:hypothetical protein J6590_043963 [Homalodisca vitripennis]|nr:hypothetical protein J6590_043963 [Homalodisca vitripennis]
MLAVPLGHYVIVQYTSHTQYWGQGRGWGHRIIVQYTLCSHVALSHCNIVLPCVVTFPSAHRTSYSTQIAPHGGTFPSHQYRTRSRLRGRVHPGLSHPRTVLPLLTRSSLTLSRGSGETSDAESTFHRKPVLSTLTVKLTCH